LVFERERFFTRLLHNQTPYALERRLQFEGIHLVILPVRIFDAALPGNGMPQPSSDTSTDWQGITAPAGGK
jgi:hypothetical protein